MIRSMTGFGKAEFEVNNKKITIEIKSLNSKQIDINTRTPALYREKDILIRKALSEKLVRGKIDFNIYVENLGDETNSKINEPILKAYFNHLSKISNDLGLPVDHSTLHSTMRLPDVVKTEYETLDEMEWETIYANILAALDDINDFRTKEGKALEDDIVGNVKAINQLLADIEPYEKSRIDALKVRLTDNLEALKMNGNVDENRFE